MCYFIASLYVKQLTKAVRLTSTRCGRAKRVSIHRGRGEGGGGGGGEVWAPPPPPPPGPQVHT
jgi:hypothetical protein